MTKFKDYLCEASKPKPTPQLKNLKKEELIEFLDSFIYNIDSLDVTEKMAGQMLKARYDAENKQTLVAPKALDGWKIFEKYNYHKDVMTVLDKFFTKRNVEQEIHFEVLSDSDAHDFINYSLKGKVVIDFRGVLSDKDKNELNRIDKNIHFMTKMDIKIKHTNGIEKIKKLYETKWKKQIEDMKTLKDLRSLVLPEIQSTLGDYISREFRSAINNSDAVEGFFMVMNGKGMKIPAKMFADLQRINVGVVNICKMPVGKVKERIQNPEDRLVLDMIKFLNSNINLQIDDEHLYNRLMSVEQSLELINKYNKDGNTLDLYTSIKKIIKK